MTIDGIKIRELAPTATVDDTDVFILDHIVSNDVSVTVTQQISWLNLKENIFSGDIEFEGSVSFGAPVTIEGGLDVNGPITGEIQLRLDELTNVTISQPQKDQALIWNGFGWVNGDVVGSGGGGGGSLPTELTHLPFAGAQDPIVTMKVTVGQKTAKHRYPAGSVDALGNVVPANGKSYFIDGEEAPFIILNPGRTYHFDLSDSDLATYPFALWSQAESPNASFGSYIDENVDTGAPADHVKIVGTQGNVGAYLEISLPDFDQSGITRYFIYHYQSIAKAKDIFNPTNAKPESLLMGNTLCNTEGNLAFTNPFPDQLSGGGNPFFVRPVDADAIRDEALALETQQEFDDFVAKIEVEGGVYLDEQLQGKADIGTDGLVVDHQLPPIAGVELDDSTGTIKPEFLPPGYDKPAEIEIDGTTTGDPGSEAKVEDVMDSDPHKASLHFTIPRGDKGEKGEPGTSVSIKGAFPVKSDMWDGTIDWASIDLEVGDMWVYTANGDVNDAEYGVAYVKNPLFPNAYPTSESEFNDQFDELGRIVGPAGPDGEKGDDGLSSIIVGEADKDHLEQIALGNVSTAELGYIWIVTEQIADGEGFEIGEGARYSDASKTDMDAFTNVGQIKGDDGAAGPAGPDGPQGEKGDGWTGGSYDSSTGVVSFTSDVPALEFDTDDLRGQDAQQVTVTVDPTPETLDEGLDVKVEDTGAGDGIDVQLKFSIPKGDTGEKGDDGDTPVVTVGDTTTAAPGTPAGVTDTGTGPLDVKLDFTIPQGVKGDDGTSVVIKGTVTKDELVAIVNPEIGDLYILSERTSLVNPKFLPGDGAVYNGGDSASLDGWDNIGPIRGPEGPQGIQGIQGETGPTGYTVPVTVGNTTTGTPGDDATVTDTGDKTPGAEEVVLEFSIPQGVTGDTGPAATITVGNTTTLAPGASATVTNTGDTSAAVFDFGIPEGTPGTGLDTSLEVLGDSSNGVNLRYRKDIGGTDDEDLVPMQGTNGISVEYNGGIIEVSGADIPDTVKFKGGILATGGGETAEDPATLLPAPDNGDYFIFTNDGDAWDGTAVLIGDWAIYEDTTPGWIVLNYNTDTTSFVSKAGDTMTGALQNDESITIRAEYGGTLGDTWALKVVDPTTSQILAGVNRRGERTHFNPNIVDPPLNVLISEVGSNRLLEIKETGEILSGEASGDIAITADNQLTTKKYVDGLVGAVPTGFLPLEGGTLNPNGLIIKSDSNSTSHGEFFVKNASDEETFRINANGSFESRDWSSSSSLGAAVSITNPSNVASTQILYTGLFRMTSAVDSGDIFTIDHHSGGRYFTIGTDGKMSAGTKSDPFLAQENHDIVTKKYFDDQTATQLDDYLPLVGGTLTGPLDIKATGGTAASFLTGYNTFNGENNVTFELNRGDRVTLRQDDTTSIDAQVLVYGNTGRAFIVKDPDTNYENVRIHKSGLLDLRRETPSSSPMIMVMGGDVFNVMDDGNISAGADKDNPYIATEDHHLTTKKYVDTAVDGVDLSDYLPLDGGTMKGSIGFSLKNASAGYAKLDVKAPENFDPSQSTPFGLQLDISDTNSERNKFIIRTKSGDALTLHGSDDANIRNLLSYDGYFNVSGLTKLFGHGSDAATGIFKVLPMGGTNPGTDIAFSITNDGSISAGSGTASPFMATEQNHITTKKFTDETYVALDGTSTTTNNWKIKNGGKTYISIDASSEVLSLYHVANPTAGAHAANKDYVDGGFLPLSGGTLTGQLTLERVGNSQRGFAIKGSNGVKDIDLLLAFHNTTGTPDAINYFGMQDSPSNLVTNQWVVDYVNSIGAGPGGGPFLELAGGTVTGKTTFDEGLNSGGLTKITRDTGYALEVKPNNSTTNAYIHTSGKMELRPTDTGASYIFAVYPTGLSSTNSKSGFRVTASGHVKAGHDAANPFMATDDNDVATKKYVDTTSKVNVVSSTPSGIKVGDMWYNTTDDILYIKKS